MHGGAPESSVGATKSALGPFKGTRVGGWGEAWGGGPWRAGKGGDGGRQRAVWEQQKVHWSPLGSLKNLTTGAGAKACRGVAQRRWGHQKARDGGWGGGG